MSFFISELKIPNSSKEKQRVLPIMYYVWSIYIPMTKYEITRMSSNQNHRQKKYKIFELEKKLFNCHAILSVRYEYFSWLKHKRHETRDLTVFVLILLFLCLVFFWLVRTEYSLCFVHITFIVSLIGSLVSIGMHFVNLQVW